MIESRDNERLKRVRKLLSARKHRDETGLFACEGEDLVDAAREAGVEPVDLLGGGRERRPRAACVRLDAAAPRPRDRSVSPRRPSDRARDVCLALWRVGRSRQSRDAAPHGRCVRCVRGVVGRLRRPAVTQGPARVGGCRLSCAGRRVGRGAGPTRRARRPRGCSADGGRPGAPADLRARVRARRSAGRCRRRRSVATIRLPGEAESLNVAAAGAIALYELSVAAERADG